MNQNSLTVVARVRAAFGKEEEVRKELSALVGSTRLESGCLRYDLHRATEDQSVFMIYEIWKTRDDLDRHMQTAHFRAWVEKAEDLLDGPSDVTLWQILG